MTVAFVLRSPEVRRAVLSFIIKMRPEIYERSLKLDADIYFVGMKHKECHATDEGLKCHEVIDTEQMDRMCDSFKKMAENSTVLCEDGIAVVITEQKMVAVLNELFAEQYGVMDAVKSELECCPKWVVFPFALAYGLPFFE